MDRTLVSTFLRITLLGLALFVGAGLLSGCREEGPFEEAGEEIEEVIDEIEDEI